MIMKSNLKSKQILALLLTVCLLFAAGCAKTTVRPVESDHHTAAPTPTPTSTPTPTPTPTPEPTETPAPTAPPTDLERMQAPVSALLFYCLTHDLEPQWEPRIFSERVFSSAYSMYGFFYYYRYAFGTDSGERLHGYQVVPESDVIAAGYAMFPDFSGSPRDYLTSATEVDGATMRTIYDESTQQYAFQLYNPSGGAGEQLDCVMNADGSADVTYEILEGGLSERIGTCQVHLTPFTAPDQNADYYAYTIQSITITRN